MIIKMMEEKVRYYSSDLFDGNFPFLSLNEDSMLLNNVSVTIVKSEDSAYHIELIKSSLGNTPAIAENNANSISFPTTQKDSVFYFPKGFPISGNNKFRNQRVTVVIEVPVGKKIMIDRSIDRYSEFDINLNRRREWKIDKDNRWDYTYSWRHNVQYIMTDRGLERTDKKEEQEDDERIKKSKTFKLKADDNGVEIEGDLENGKGTYRYKKSGNNEKMEIDTIKPAAPKPLKPAKPSEDGKITSSENKNEHKKIAGKITSENLRLPFLFLTTGR
jgi:hypothetical protein